jgi:hypothetical protein
MNLKNKAPPLPRSAFSHLGPLPVVEKTLDPDADYRGKVNLHSRKIVIDESLPPALALQTYWHECVHLALNDGAVRLPEKLEEQICDVMGTYLAAACRTGFLKVNDTDVQP